MLLFEIILLCKIRHLSPTSFPFQFVDGWELNGEYFPSPADHALPMNSRFHEFCGQRKVKQVFTSSQNVALIQYRMPAKGSSFGFSVRFIKNITRKSFKIKKLSLEESQYKVIRSYLFFCLI